MTRARDLASTALNSTVNTTELGYLDGVTSSVQTQLDAKAPSSTAVTLTGTQTLTNKTLTSPVLTTPTISTVDAKGDLLVGTADNTVDRLAAGNSGEQLVADSSTSTGLRYTAGTVQANPILNSAAQIWQRGTSVTGSTTAFCADRWQAYRNTTGSTFSRQVTGDTTNLPNIQYAIRAQRNSGDTATNDLNITQNIETANSIPFAGKTVTVSFYARKGANFSSSTSSIFTQVFTGTGTDQNVYSGYTGQAVPNNTSATLTTTWQRFTATFAIAATATEISILFGYNPVGTAGAADYFELTGVQMDIGSVALPFRTYAGTIQGELAACQRYYWLAASGTIGVLGTGLMQSATRFHQPIIFPNTMRTAPSLVATSGTNYYSFQTSGDDNFNSLTIANASAQSCYVFNNTEISGTGGQAGTTFTNNASASVAFSAEL